MSTMIDALLTKLGSLQLRHLIFRVEDRIKKFFIQTIRIKWLFQICGILDILCRLSKQRGGGGEQWTTCCDTKYCESVIRLPNSISKPILKAKLSCSNWINLIFWCIMDWLWTPYFLPQFSILAIFAIYTGFMCFFLLCGWPSFYCFFWLENFNFWFLGSCSAAVESCYVKLESVNYN